MTSEQFEYHLTGKEILKKNLKLGFVVIVLKMLTSF